MKVGIVDLHRRDVRAADDSAGQEAAGEPSAGKILVDELHLKMVAPLSDARYQKQSSRIRQRITCGGADGHCRNKRPEER